LTGIPYLLTAPNIGIAGGRFWDISNYRPFLRDIFTCDEVMQF